MDLYILYEENILPVDPSGISLPLDFPTTSALQRHLSALRSTFWLEREMVSSRIGTLTFYGCWSLILIKTGREALDSAADTPQGNSISVPSKPVLN